MQNAAARLITNTRRCEHITPVLHQLHWLPVRQRVCNSRSPCWCTRYCTTSCLRIWRKIANLCLSLDANNCVRRTSTRAYRSEQHSSWRSLIRYCWISRMEQSANPTARVWHYYTRTISTSTQNASILSVAAAAPIDCFSCTVYKFAYLLTYELKACLETRGCQT